MPTTVTVEVSVDMDVPKEVFVDWIRSQLDPKTMCNDICGWPRSEVFVDALDEYEDRITVQHIKDLVAISCSFIGEESSAQYKFRPITHLPGAYIRKEYLQNDVAYVREKDMFLVTGVELICPRCGGSIEDYPEDPRGHVIDCPHCKEKFTLSFAAKIEFY